MHSIFILGLYWLAGLMTFAMAFHLAIGIYPPRDRAQILFSCMCLLVVLFTISQALGLQTTDVATYIWALKMNLSAVIMLFAIFPWFIALYTGMRSLPFLTAWSVYFFVLFVANLVDPYSLQYSRFNGLETVRLPWNEVVTQGFGSNGAWFYASVIAIAGVFIYAVVGMIKKYRRQHLNEDLIIFFTIILFLLSAIQGIMVRLGIMDGIVLGPFGFVALTLAMSASVGLGTLLKLRNSERHFRSLFENSPTGKIAVDPATGDIIFANPVALRMTGFDAEEILTKGVADLTCPEDMEDSRHRYEQLVTGQVEHMHYERNYRTKDGGSFIADHYASALKDDDDKVVLLIANITDITERKRTEEALDQSEEKYRTIFENSPLGIFRSNIQGHRRNKYVEVNPALAKMLGYDSPEQMIREVDDIGRNVYANPAEREDVVSRQLQAPDDVMQHLCHYKRRDGSECIANLYLKTVRDSEGTPDFFEGIVEDITERMHVEEALRSSEEKYRTIFENSPLGIFRSYLQGEKFVQVNPALATILGFNSPEQMIREVDDIGKQLYANPTQREKIVSRQLQAPDDVMQHLGHYKRRDGSECIANLYLKTIRDVDGTPVFLEGIVEDITDRVQFEIALQEKSEELYKLNMELRRLSAHREDIIEQERTRISQDLHDELGQNLTALLMNISTLKAIGSDLNEDIVHGLDHAHGLVEKSMDKAREIVSQLRPKSIDMGLSASLEGLIDSYFSSTGINCELELDEWDDSLISDAATISLYRIVQESLTNVARYAQTDNVIIALSGRGGNCQLIVRDEGVGFDPKLIEDNSFGLLGIRERIASLGGSFVIDSKKGKGTALRVMLPVSKKRNTT